MQLRLQKARGLKSVVSRCDGGTYISRDHSQQELTGMKLQTASQGHDFLTLLHCQKHQEYLTDGKVPPLPSMPSL